MVQILKSHVFFHLMTEDYLIASVQKVLQVVNHGAPLRLMREDTTWMANGEIVLLALSVEQVVHCCVNCFKFYRQKLGFFVPAFGFKI